MVAENSVTRTLVVEMSKKEEKESEKLMVAKTRKEDQFLWH